MLVLGLDLGLSLYDFSSLDFEYYNSKYSANVSSINAILGFGFYGTYNFKQSPLFIGWDLSFNSGNSNISWDVYGFKFETTRKIDITKYKFIIGLYNSSEKRISQAGFALQRWSLKFNGDNGYSNGSSIGFGLVANNLYSISNQTYLGFSGFYDYVSSITTIYSQDNNLKVISKSNHNYGFKINISFSIE